MVGILSRRYEATAQQEKNDYIIFLWFALKFWQRPTLICRTRERRTLFKETCEDAMTRSSLPISGYRTAR
ncbi:MAG: hypothetical protein IN818_04730 [Cutibacterium sp.]|nr:hypothetical protein [Cutibacterium sp.]